MKHVVSASLCALLGLLAACSDPPNNTNLQIAPDTGMDAQPEPEPDAAPDAEPEPEPDPTIIKVRFEPDEASFYSVPWPSDARLTEAGNPDLSDFPSRSGVVDTLLSEMETSIKGFAAMPVVYIGLTSPAAPESLLEPLESLSASSAVQLIDLSEAGCGTRVPVEMAMRLEADKFTDANVLQIKNAIGTMLEPGVPYGLILLQSFGEPEGRTTPRPEAFDAALAGDGSKWDTSLEPLRRCLPDAGVLLDDVAVATVFTPQDPVVEMKVMRDFVMDPDKIETRAIVDMKRSDPWSRNGLRLRTFTGFVELPIFQKGQAPYTNEGGGLAFDENGQPEVQRWESVEMALSWRLFDEEPEGPRPILVFMDGTGWSNWSHLYSNWMANAMSAGFVVASFMPQFHGGRGGFSGSTEISTFNFVNPAAGRANFRQQAAETSYFIRVLREQVGEVEGLPPLDTDNIVYGGHSQGALVGALVAGVETEFKAYAFNGLSSYLTLTLLFRKDIIDFQLIIKSLFEIRRDLDIFDPILQIFQLGAEVVDPHNYARRWRGWEGLPQGNHVFVTNGFTDSTTTPRGMDHLTMVSDLTIIDTPGWEIDPEGVWDGEPALLPIVGNKLSSNGEPLTQATYLDSVQGHFTIYRKFFLRQIISNFWNTALEGVPELNTFREFQCLDGLDDDGDMLLDCEDPDCADIEPCVETACEDMADGDGDGDIDCDDSDCWGESVCAERACGDGEDNDFDELVDCDDPDCANRFPCGESRCSDGNDDDGDGLIDCDDDQCARASICTERNCIDGEDSDRDDLIDCDDPDCATSVACAEQVCDDTFDNDSNSYADCADPGCLGTDFCPLDVEVECDNGEDDDGDELIDCDDPDCATADCFPDDCADGDIGTRTGPAVFTGDLNDYDDDYYSGDCLTLGRGEGSRDIALRWTAPADGTYEVSTWGSDFDTVVSFYRDSCDRDSEFGCDDDDGPVFTSSRLLEINEGVDIVIVVSGFGAEDAGLFQLHILPRE